MKNKLSSRNLLFIILAAAVLLRLAAALYMGDRIPRMPGIYDEVSYHTLATRILQGYGFSFPEEWYPFTHANEPTAHWSFAYPPFLAAVYAVTGVHPLAARLLQAILTGALTSLLVFLIARRLVNERTGLLAALLAAGYGYFIYYDAALMTEPFFIVFVLLAIYLSIRLVDRPSMTGWIGFGLALGIATLLRQTVLFLAPLLLIWLAMELRDSLLNRPGSRFAGQARWWHLGVPILLVAAMILPWTARNYLRYHTVLLLNSNSGYALYASTYPTLGTHWSTQVEDVVIPIPPELSSLNEAQKNKALSRMATQNVLADPGRITLLTLSKALEYFKFWPTAQSGMLSNVVRVFSFGVYLPFMLWGLILSFRNGRKFIPLYLAILTFAGLHILSWPAPRYRLPSDAIMMVFAAMAVLELVRLVSLRRQPVKTPVEVKG